MTKGLHRLWTQTAHTAPFFPTGTISLWLIVLIISPAPFHVKAKCAVIATGERKRGLCAQILCCSAEEWLSRRQLSTHAHGSRDSWLANRRVFPFPLVFWDCPWGLLGYPVQSRNVFLQPPGPWFPRDTVVSFKLLCYRPGEWGLFLCLVLK